MWEVGGASAALKTHEPRCVRRRDSNEGALGNDVDRGIKHKRGNPHEQSSRVLITPCAQAESREARQWEDLTVHRVKAETCGAK